jgi:hypothetical protein
MCGREADEFPAEMMARSDIWMEPVGHGTAYGLSRREVAYMHKLRLFNQESFHSLYYFNLEVSGRSDNECDVLKQDSLTRIRL